MTGREFQERLSLRVQEAGSTIRQELIDKLWVYFTLLQKWNEKINLTGLSLSDPAPAALDRLLVEPVLAATYAAGANAVIDIGSGGGSPALPFALALSDVALTMVEVRERKSVFLKEAIRELGLERAEVVTARHEDLIAIQRFHETYDVLTIRAVRVEDSDLRTLEAFVAPAGRIFHFRTAEGRQAATDRLPAGLSRISDIPLCASLKSELTILRKPNSS